MRIFAALGFVGVVFAFVFAPAVAFADNYQVAANVPYKPPTVASTFPSGIDGMSTSNALLHITGTCQVKNDEPPFIVSIWRDNKQTAELVGSTACNQGVYAIDVNLALGPNRMFVRSGSVSNLYGPDSPVFVVTLYRPSGAPVPTPVTSPNAIAGLSPTQQTIATNAGAASGLVAGTTTPFATISADNKSIDIGILIGGGIAPYQLALNWGDGTTENHLEPSAGTYDFSHTYRDAGNYQIHGQFFDASGAETTFNYAVVFATVPQNYHQNPTQTGSHGAGNGVLLPTLTVGGGAILLIGLSYWLGLHRVFTVKTLKKRSPNRGKKTRR